MIDCASNDRRPDRQKGNTMKTDHEAGMENLTRGAAAYALFDAADGSDVQGDSEARAIAVEECRRILTAAVSRFPWFAGALPAGSPKGAV